MDPFIDDCVMFTRKLKRLGNDIQFDILDGLPHGFLNFSLVSIRSGIHSPMYKHYWTKHDRTTNKASKFKIVLIKNLIPAVKRSL